MTHSPQREDYCLSMDLKLGSHLRALPGPILITGHTGFKGTWLTFLLEHLGVATVGYSLAPEVDSLYDRAKRTGQIPETFADIRDGETLRNFLAIHKPSAIIHMAAQPLVLQSYKTPRETFDVNVMGTANVLDESFTTDFVQAVIVVTTDKVYRNDNSGRSFVESDPLEGKDPYSASKVGTEAVVSAWQHIQKVSGGPKVASVRAGNVIGGGDWAENRLIPDLVRGFISGAPIEIRNSTSTRPWQHVLDPLSGYLLTLEKVLKGEKIFSVNFASGEKSMSVGMVAEIAKASWGSNKQEVIFQNQSSRIIEAEYLSLDSSYARKKIDWEPYWTQELAVQETILWWKKVINDSVLAESACLADIERAFRR